jgi:cytochrome-b5 reductase
MSSNQLILSLTGLATALAAVFIYLKNSNLNSERKVLNKDEFQEFPLIQKVVLSKDSAIFRFGLPNPTDVLGLPIGQHIQISADIDGKNVMHSYTPTSLDQDSKGFFDLLIKVYPNGKLSTYIDKLELGEKIKVKGPKGFYKYEPNMLKHICMVAGGTGITPMYQIIKAILTNSNDKTKITLLYGSQSESDILLRSELDEFAEKHDNFNLIHFLDNAPENWNGKTGYITKDALIEHFPKPNDDIQLLLCGPPGLVSSIKKASNELGFAKAKPVSKAGDQVFLF